MAHLLTPQKPIDFSKAINQSIVKQKSALVTGGASGIGLAIASTLAEAGAYVTIADLNESAGKQTVDTIRGKGFNINFVKTNVTSWDEQAAVFEQAASSAPSKTVDIVVTAAGITSKLGSVPDPSKLDKPVKPPMTTWDVNLYGTIYSMYLALWYFSHSPPDPAKQLLFISSMAGYSSPGATHMSADYGSSKFGVRGLWLDIHPLRDQYAGARFNLLAPFYIDTPMMEPGEMDDLKSRGWKVGTIEDVLDGAMRCICDGDVSGRAIAILGGEANGGFAGSANFDLCDDIPGHMAGEAMLQNLMQGKFMSFPTP